MRRLPNVNAARLLRQPVSVIAVKPLLASASPTISGIVTTRVRDSLVLRRVHPRNAVRQDSHEHGGR